MIRRLCRTCERVLEGAFWRGYFVFNYFLDHCCVRKVSSVVEGHKYVWNSGRRVRCVAWDMSFVLWIEVTTRCAVVEGDKDVSEFRETCVSERWYIKGYVKNVY